jgi:hypothetical protein
LNLSSSQVAVGRRSEPGLWLGNGRVASAQQPEGCGFALPIGTHSSTLRASAKGIKASVRFSFQGPRERVAPESGAGDCSCATLARQAFLGCFVWSLLACPEVPQVTHRYRTPATALHPVDSAEALVVPVAAQLWFSTGFPGERRGIPNLPSRQWNPTRPGGRRNLVAGRTKSTTFSWVQPRGGGKGAQFVDIPVSTRFSDQGGFDAIVQPDAPPALAGPNSAGQGTENLQRPRRRRLSQRHGTALGVGADHDSVPVRHAASRRAPRGLGGKGLAA